MQSSRPPSTTTRSAVSPLPNKYQVNTQTKVLDTAHGRILCIADIRGHLSTLNDLARDANAKAIIHTGDFGFFESNSLDRINDRTLRHLTMYSPLIPSAQRTHLLAPENPPSLIRSTIDISLLSEFPLLLSGQIKLQVPVFTVWGACEDVLILEKFRSGSYAIDNLQILDEATTRCLEVGGVKLRLLGLGGALVYHKLFDNGEGRATIAGGQGTMWATALQIGELVDTAQRVYDPTETRLLVTHASPGREGILAQLALIVKADLTISAGLHFRYASSYNEFSVQSDFAGFRHKLEVGKDGFDKVWESVKTQVDAVMDDHQRVLMDKALSVINKLPPAQDANAPPNGPPAEEPAWKNCWNWNLCDAAYGSLVLDVKEGRVSAELKSQGFNYAYRHSGTKAATPALPSATLPSASPNPNSRPPTKGTTPAPQEHLHEAAAQQKSAAPTPPPQASAQASATATPRVPPAANGSASLVPSGVSIDKAEKDKAKKKDKKERKDKDDGKSSAPPSGVTSPTPDANISTPVLGGPADTSVNRDDVKSPTTESSGVRTPLRGKPPRHPWTLFMKVNTPGPLPEEDVREFFQDAKSGITRVTFPQVFSNRPYRIAFIDFGDEEAMNAGLQKHAEKILDTVPEVKQATDRDARGSDGPRGRGRGRGGAFAARGFAAAGLTRGSFHGRNNAPASGGDGPKTGGD
ncbi:hypothetical protein HGRIS_009193 [Hohenbuehelia grisea]|uniref:DUF2433 domain-containing protein n=1 Tax=Hohenbuehelia grisea TaxID=104357 RepID=A0ABR3J0H9_9AGAR